MSYLEHLNMNLLLAFRWLTFSEEYDDIEFEEDTNKNSLFPVR